MSIYIKISVISGVFALGAAVQSAAAAETRSYVIDWLTPATYSQDGDCSKGLNPDIEKIYFNSLIQQGFPRDKAEKMMQTFNNVLFGELAFAIENRARVNGQPVNVYQNPTGQPDTNLNPVDGKFGFGFNLDGKGPEAGPSYEHPLTHEKGIDNNHYRAVGCINSHRAMPPHRTAHGAYVWDGLRSTMPAWIISISGDDLSKDGDVTVRMEGALEAAPVDANGAARKNYTFRINPDPRAQNEFKGRIKDGVVHVDTGHLSLRGDPYFVTEFDLLQTHMRIELKDDGNIAGIIGGYQDWVQLYNMYGLQGSPQESMIGFDTPGIFYALRKWADAYPDPKTGDNTRISTAWRVEAVPAFVVRPTDDLADNSSARQAATGG